MLPKPEFPIPDPVPDSSICMLCKGQQWTYRRCKNCRNKAPVCGRHNRCPVCGGTEFYIDGAEIW